MTTSRRLRRIAGLVVGLLVVLASSAGAARMDSGPEHHHLAFGLGHFVAFNTTTQIVGGDSGCDPTVPTRCAGTFRTVRTYTGDFSGTAYLVGSAVVLSDGTYQGQDVAQFTGTVKGCGRGTLVILESGILDPVSAAEHGNWKVVAGQGTGDLAGMSGRGSARSTAGGGWIRCR